MEKQSIKKNTLYNAIKTFSTIIFPLITIPYVNRILLTENIGKVDFGLSVISYFALIASLGIATYAIRECSAVRNDREKLGAVASQIFSINVFTTAAAYLLLFLTLLFFRKFDSYRTLILIQSLSILFTTLGTDWLNSAVEDFRYITIRTIIFQLIALVLMFVFIRRPEDYLKYAAISLVSSSGAHIVNIFYRKKYCAVKFTKKIDWKKHFGPIMLLFVMILAQDIFTNVDSTMLGLMQGDRAVGLYSTAHKVNRVVSQVVSSILWVIMPRMSYYFAEGNYTEINHLLRKLLGYNLLVGLPCVVGQIVIAQDIILVAAGPEFLEAAPVLQVRSLSMLFALFGGNLLGNAILLPSKKEKYYMIVCLITAFINIVANYLLIPVYGPVGAAITTAFCSLCILVMLLFKVDRRIRFERVARLAVSPLVGCAGIVVVCLLLSSVGSAVLRIPLSIGLSVLLYGCIQLLFKNELATELFQLFLKKIKKA